MEDLKHIIAELERQKSAIEKAITALREVGIGDKGTRVAVGAATSKSAATPTRAKRRLSPEGRQRIIEATKKRWAAQRAAQANAAKRGGRKKQSAASAE